MAATMRFGTGVIVSRWASPVLAAVLTAWGAVAFVAVAAAEAAVGSVPDSAQLVELRRVVATSRVLRVAADFGWEAIGDPILDSTGIRSASWHQRPALITTVGTPPRTARPPIPWTRISTLQVGRSKTLQGAVGGTLIGLVLGAGLAMATIPSGYSDEADGYRAVALFGGTAVLGTIVGTYLGWKSGFRTIYQAEGKG